MDVAFGNGLFVAVGDAGQILSSADGESWTQNPSGNLEGTNNLVAIFYADGKFVALGNASPNGPAFSLTSTNGIAWRRSDIGAATLRAITFGNGNIVAVGDSGHVFTSSDANVWTEHSGNPNLSWSDVTFGNGVFVASGMTNAEPGVFEGALSVSSDGIHWTDTLLPQVMFMRAAVYADGTFVAAGYTMRSGGADSKFLARSASGKSWDVALVDNLNWLPGSFYRFQYVDGSYYLGVSNLSGESFFASSDAINWTYSSPMAGIRSIAAGAGKLVAVGRGFPVTGVPDVKIAVSNDGGASWKNVIGTPDFSTHYTGVAYGNNRFVAVGYGRPGNLPLDSRASIVSTDGADWAGIGIAGISSRFSEISFGKGLFVALAQIQPPDHPLGPLPGLIETSADGLYWASPALPITNQLNGITYAGSGFVAVGDAGTILSSIDGTNWVQEASSTTAPLAAVTSGNGLFVAAVADSATVLTSTNTQSWIPANLGNDVGPLKQITFGNGHFVGLTSENRIATSDDGVHWARQDFNAGTNILAGVAFGNGVFAAVGTSIYTSLNGSHWTQRTGAEAVSLEGISFGNGTFVTAGANSQIWQSQPVIHLTASRTGLSNGQTLQLTIESNVVPELILEMSTDLQSWSRSQVLTNVTGLTQWTEPAPDSRRRFYRVRIP